MRHLLTSLDLPSLPNPGSRYKVSCVRRVVRSVFLFVAVVFGTMVYSSAGWATDLQWSVYVRAAEDRGKDLQGSERGGLKHAHNDGLLTVVGRGRGQKGHGRRVCVCGGGVRWATRLPEDVTLPCSKVQKGSREVYKIPIHKLALRLRAFHWSVFKIIGSRWS